LKKSLRAIERAFADIESLFAGPWYRDEETKKGRNPKRGADRCGSMIRSTSVASTASGFDRDEA